MQLVGLHIKSREAAKKDPAEILQLEDEGADGWQTTEKISHWKGGASFRWCIASSINQIELLVARQVAKRII